MDFSTGTKDSLRDLGHEFVEEIGISSKLLFQHAGLKDVCCEYFYYLLMD
jgi:hypothetical protein